MDIFPPELWTFSSEVAMDISLLVGISLSRLTSFRNRVRPILLVFSAQGVIGIPTGE